MIKPQDIILTIIAVHSITLAMGLFWIYSTQSRVNEEILKRNYKLAEKNSLYNFNEKITNFLKALIPFYYFIQGLNIIKDSGDYKATVDKAIASGKYEPIDFEYRKKEPEVKVTVPEPKVEFELTKEKFKARKNDSSLYDPTETPIEYSERIMAEEQIKMAPFIDKAIVKNVYDNIENNEKETITSEFKNISPQDLATHISKLNKNELIALSEVIEQLLAIKGKNYIRTLEKDVA